MKRTLFIPLLSLVLLAVVGCDSGTEGDSEQDLLSLISQLDSPGESLITSSRSGFVAVFEPSASGVLGNGTHWGVMTPEETRTLQMGLIWGMVADGVKEMRNSPSMHKAEEIQAPVDCTLESGANVFVFLCFAKSVHALHNHCDGAWTWTDDEGNTHANGHNLVPNEQGNMQLVDCDPPDEE